MDNNTMCAIFARLHLAFPGPAGTRDLEFKSFQRDCITAVRGMPLSGNQRDRLTAVLVKHCQLGQAFCEKFLPLFAIVWRHALECPGHAAVAARWLTETCGCELNEIRRRLMEEVRGALLKDVASTRGASS